MTDAAENDVAAMPDPQLAAALAGALSGYPYYANVMGFGDDAERAKRIAYFMAMMPPVHPTQPANKMTFAHVMVDPEVAQKTSIGTHYSRTNLPLAPHTDSTALAEPHSLVIFHMIRQAGEGGESTVVAVDDVVKALGDDVKALLREPVYPQGRIDGPVLMGQPGNEWMRYYRAQLDKTVEDKGLTLSARHVQALDALDEVLDRLAEANKFILEPGEMLFLNNLRVLHGRTGFVETSDRLMYRVRAHAGCLLVPG